MYTTAVLAVLPKSWPRSCAWVLLAGLVATTAPAGAGARFSAIETRTVAEGETARESASSNYVKPHWSPEARMLSFETLKDQQRRLFVYDAAKGAANEVVSTASSSSSSPFLPGSRRSSRAVANFDLTWARSGSGFFAYVGSGSQGYFGLYYMDPLQKGWGDFWAIVGGEPGDPYVALPDFHPKYDYLVYCQGEMIESEADARLEMHGLESLPKLKGKQTRGQRLSNRQELPQLDPSFSPAGSEIVFTGIDRGNNDIYKTSINVTGNADGSVRRVAPGQIVQLTRFPTPEGKATWSPDGRLIAFLSGQGENKNEWGLWVMNADGTNQRKLVNRVLDEDAPEWHPDGEHLFFVRILEEEQNPIQFVNVKTNELGTLLADTALHTHLDISADGSQIAFCARGQRDDKNLTWLKLYVAKLVKR